MTAMPDEKAGQGSTGMPKMPRPSETAIARFREVVPDDPRVSLRPMFGNLSAFANGWMFAGLFGEDVFVRLGEADAAALTRAGGTPFAPMPGRPMSGYLVIPGDWARDPERSREIVGKAFEHTIALPPKPAKSGSKR
jgi:TfoX/Sxy family transcriptional regulator of competence genes